MEEIEAGLDDRLELPFDEDSETLAAIDRGIQDADAGRLIPLEEVEALIPQWVSKFSSPTAR